jgi:hypothetical protein
MSANGGRGGGIFLEGVGSLSQSVVYSNAATFNGGGVSVGSNGANPKIDRVIIRDNRAGVGGGFSIFLTGGATLQNSLLIRNVATSTVPMIGQAVEVFGGNAIHTPEGGSPAKPLNIINVTIADNPGAVPEAVKVEGLADLSTTRPNHFTNVLISGNSTGIRSDGLGVASLTKVLITNDVTTKLDGFAPDRLTGAPLDGVAGYVGGGDYHLTPGADGVDDGDTVSGITQDLDGLTRPLGPAYDIGAYETTVAKLNQAITFAPIGNRPLAGSPFTVNPTSDSGLPVSLASLTTAVCTVSGFTVTLVAVGSCTLEATQPGNAAFSPAASVQRSFEVSLVVDQTITFGALPNRALADSPFTVTATASSGLPVQLTSLTPGVCMVSGFEVTVLAVGTCTLEANQPGNANVNPAPAVTRSFEIGIDAPKETLHMPLLERQ